MASVTLHETLYHHSYQATGKEAGSFLANAFFGRRGGEGADVCRQQSQHSICMYPGDPHILATCDRFILGVITLGQGT